MKELPPLKRGQNFQTKPRGYSKLSCSTQLSKKFLLLINVKMPTVVGILAFMSRKIMKIFLLINVKMPTTVGILTFMSRKLAF